MRDGLYRYVDTADATNCGEYIIKLHETATAYIFKKIKNDMRFSPAHLDMMFKSSDKVTVNKKRSPHAINTVGDDWYCMYPYRRGAPYVFELMEANE